MFRLYFIIDAKIDRLQLRLSGRLNKKTESLRFPFDFDILRTNFMLLLWNLAAHLVKYFIIITIDAGKGFSHFFSQCKANTCPYSYVDYKKLQRRLRTFSVGGLFTFAAAAAVVGLVLNLIFGGRIPGYAATFGWVQTKWDSIATPGLIALHDQASWGNSSTTAFEAKDSLVTINNPAPGDSYISQGTTTSSLTLTDDSASVTGFNLQGADFNQTQLINNGTSTSLVLGISSSTTFVLGGGSKSTPTFKNANGVAYDERNNKIYVVDTGNNSINSYDSGDNGTTFGANFEIYKTFGAGNSTLNAPERIAIDPGNNVMFVSDTNGNRIVYFDYSSTSMATSFFSSLGGFGQPSGLSIDKFNQKLFVADKNNNAIQVMDYTSNSLAFDHTVTYTDSFSFPTGVAFSSTTGKLYIADTSGSRLVSCDYDLANGSTTNWQTMGGLNLPADIVIDEISQTGYLSNTGDNEIILIDLAGGAMSASSTIAISSAKGLALSPNRQKLISTSYQTSGKLVYMDTPVSGNSFGDNISTIGDIGSGVSQYNSGKDVFVDSVNFKIYVIDATRVIRYDSGYGGTKFGDNWQVFASTTNPFISPEGIFVDTASDKVYIADKHRIIRFDTGNAGGTSFGSNWEEVVLAGSPVWIKDIFVDTASPKKAYFFVKLLNGTITLNVFSAGEADFGQDMVEFGSTGIGDYQFMTPNSLYFDHATDYVYFTDDFTPRIANFKINLATGTTSDWHAYGLSGTLFGAWLDTRNSALYVSADQYIYKVDIGADNSFTGDSTYTDNVSTRFKAIYGDTVNNKLFLIDNAYRIVRTDISATVNTYYTSGAYTSGAYDTGQKNLDWGLLSWDSRTNGQTMTVKARSAQSSDMSDATPWNSCANLTNGQDLDSYACIKESDRYIQYEVIMGTNYDLESPILNDIGLDFSYYPSNQTLTSSIYNSLDAGNVLGLISWNENQNDAFVYASISLRSATSAADISSAAWQTIDVPNDCAKNSISGTVDCDFNLLRADLPTLYDGLNDQFFQYRLNLLSPGDVAPTIDSIDMKYVINISPEAEITNAPIQATDGTVQINYRVRDLDTNSGATAGRVFAGLQYWNGSAWVTASTSDFSQASDIGLVDVAVASTTDWTDYSLTWLASTSFSGQYFATTSGFKVRITAYDGEIANNTGFGTSSDFRLDTLPPASAKIMIDASQTTGTNQIAGLAFEAIDDSAVEMRLGLDPNLADAGGWSPFIATTSTILPDDPESVYVQFRDAFLNTTAIISATHPAAPANEMIRDITNPSAEIFQLFMAWKKDTDPANFKQYVIFRSEDEGLTYDQYTTISSSSINYFFDNNFEFDGGVVTKKYYYRIAIENLNGDRSHYNLSLSDIPDGQGVDMNPPVITNVSHSATSTQSATIVWDTNVEANSTVGFSETPGDFTNISGVATMRDNAGNFGQHRVVITGLTASTTYYYQVRSTDAFGYTVIQDKDALDVPYSFTTQPGPIISGVSTSSVTETSATISWNTNLPADSTITYSASTSFANALQVTNSDTFELAHSMTLQNLALNTKYYFYVTSRDEEGYEAIGKNLVDEEYVNFEFTTLADAAFPVSTSTTCSKSGDSALLVSWFAEKPAISRLLYGTSQGNYASSTSFTSNFDTAQTALIENLLASTTYYFITVNADQTNNFSTSSEFACATNEKLISENEALTQVQNAYSTGRNDGASSVPASAGGGVLIIDKNDKTAPLITDARVMDVSTSSARLIWQTDESASSFVEYGTTINYDSNWGRPELTKAHISEIRGLQPGTVYHYRLSSADGSGNLAKSEDRVIKTLTVSDELLSNGLASSTRTEQEVTSLRDFIEKILTNASLDGFDGSLISQYNLLQKLAEAMPMPIFTGGPVAVTTTDSATITWQTDKETNSLIAVAAENVFNLNKNNAEPYYRLEGEPYQFTRNHKITLADLKPGTTYHYQARSRAQLGLSATSRDFTFRTKEEGLAITNFNSEIKAGDEVIFKWLTNEETDAQLKFTPYRDNQLVLDEAKIVEDRKRTKNHELTMKELQPGTIYQVELSGMDYAGKKVSKTIPTFVTAKDTVVPQISQIQTESALSQGKDRTVQTIVSWTTNEPTICEFSYERGVSQNEELSEKTPIETTYSKKHVLVLTKFESGQVYSFRIKAKDTSGNQSISSAHTILTPKQKEGIFELILHNFEATFGWLKNVK